MLAPLAPKRPDVSDELELRDLADERLLGLRVTEVELSGDLSDRVAADLRLQDVRLTGLDLTATEAPGLTLTDAVVAGGSWANLRAARGSLVRVETKELRATGVDLSEAVLKDVVFADARLDFATFRFAELKRVVAPAGSKRRTFSAPRSPPCGSSAATLPARPSSTPAASGASFASASSQTCRESEGFAAPGCRGAR